MGYRKLQSETSDILCYLPVIIPLTCATAYSYSQHLNTWVKSKKKKPTKQKT